MAGASGRTPPLARWRVSRGQEFVAEPKATPGGRYIGTRGDALDWLEILWCGGGPHASTVRPADQAE